MSDQITGAKALVKTLEDIGVDTVFGLPGGAILNTYHEITNQTKFKHVLVRHEQGAGHAASGYAISTGKVGVAMVTSGPAATNMVTAIADANMDSVPMVVITGQVASSLIGTDAFQEADIVGITLPITKHSFLVNNASDIPRILQEAFYIASTGRPGVVLVDVTKSAMVGKMNYSFPTEFAIPGYKPQNIPQQHCFEQALDLIKSSLKPAIYAGGGLIRSQASEQLKKFASLINAPIVTTLQARGIIPDSDSKCLGMIGMHGTIASAAALQNCDLMIVLGARFSDRVTGKIDQFAKNAKIIQADIDPSEIGKNKPVDAPLFGDLKLTLNGLNERIESQIDNRAQRIKTASWWAYLNDLRNKYPLYFDLEKSDECGKNNLGELSPQFVISEIGRIAKEYDKNSIFVTGVGQHQMWSSQFLGIENPNSFVLSAGLGTMGYAIPAAMGAKQGNKDKSVWVIDGDGCFQMTNQELATCRLNNLPIKVMIINNGTLGMPRQWQTLFFNKHYSQTDLHDGADRWSGEEVTGDGVEKGGGELYIPDFVKLAQSYDCLALRVNKTSEIIPALKKAADENTRPVVIDFQVAKDALVFPMVPAGASNNDIMYKPGIQPLKEENK